MKKARKGFFIFIFILCLAILLPVLLFAYSFYVEPNRLTVTNEDYSNDKISSPLKIVFFSDTHFGSIYVQENIEKIVEKINEQNPDIVIFGGDFFDMYWQDAQDLDLEYLSSNLLNIESTFGNFAVWGNHDYGGGAVRIYEQFLYDANFTLLKNETFKINNTNITLTGIDDGLLGNPSFSYNLDKENYNLIISHEPDFLDYLDSENMDLSLAGHSHGGQVYIPFLTQRILPIGSKKYNKGSYVLENNSNLFVTSGLGMTKLPFRFLNTPEICVLTVSNENF